MASSTPPPAAKAKLKYGSCLCQAIRYSITDDPISTHLCHCTNCKKVTGSAFMWNGVFEEKQINVVQGAESLAKYSDTETKSGYTLERYFCKTCGSNVFLQPLRPAVLEKNLRIVTLGSLDSPIHWMPDRQSFPELHVPFVEGMTLEARKTRL